MMHRKLVAAAAIGASVIGGAAGGALLFAPNLSGAQEATTSVAAEASATAPAGRPGLGVRGDTLATAAKALGMTEADLRTALQGGKTIAEVAKDKGVDVQKVIDALVADAKAKLQQAEADLPSRMSDLVNGKLPLGGMGGPEDGKGFGGRMGPAFEAGLDSVASALGMTEADLRTALQSGKSIADIAKDKGVDVDTLVGKLVDAATKKIDQAVTDGKLTQDQATKLKSALKERITALVDGSRPAGGPGGGGRHGFGRGGMGGPPQGEGSSSTSGSGATTY
jgi:polyhydroxyalkanoate synthesis regulator phasin